MSQDKLSKPIAEKSRLDQVLGQALPHAPKSHRVRWVGLAVFLAFLFGFIAWSSLAPIESAAIAPGKITVTGNRRIIQHLEGGIIKKILVRDGSHVEKGQLLIQLEDTKAKASLALTQSEIYQLYAIEARLLAERDNKEVLTFNPRLLAAKKENQNLSSVMNAQVAIFTVRRASYDGNVKILKQQIEQLKEQAKGLHAQHKSNARQHELINEEVEAVRVLTEKRLIEKPRLLELQRSQARLQGMLGDNVSQLAVLQQKVGETTQKILTLMADDRKEILLELREVQQNLSDVLKKEIVEEDIFNRTSIYAPQPGSVVALQVHTLGGVIRPGDAIMDLVPDERLIIEAQVSPLDIDVVHKGLVSKVQLVAFKSRTTPTLDGRVYTVSADVYQDQQNGTSFYRAEIELDKGQLARLSADQELYPGMPVQVMIVTDRRTLFQYLFTPIKESFYRAFREQ